MSRGCSSLIYIDSFCRSNGFQFSSKSVADCFHMNAVLVTANSAPRIAWGRLYIRFNRNLLHISSLIYSAIAAVLCLQKSLNGLHTFTVTRVQGSPKIMPMVVSAKQYPFPLYGKQALLLPNRSRREAPISSEINFSLSTPFIRLMTVVFLLQPGGCCPLPSSAP